MLTVWLLVESFGEQSIRDVVFLDLSIIYVNAPRGLQKTVFVSGHDILSQLMLLCLNKWFLSVYLSVNTTSGDEDKAKNPQSVFYKDLTEFPKRF